MKIGELFLEIQQKADHTLKFIPVYHTECRSTAPRNETMHDIYSPFALKGVKFILFFSNGHFTGVYDIVGCAMLQYTHSVERPLQYNSQNKAEFLNAMRIPVNILSTSVTLQDLNSAVRSSATLFLFPNVFDIADYNTMQLLSARFAQERALAGMHEQTPGHVLERQHYAQGVSDRNTKLWAVALHVSIAATVPSFLPFLVRNRAIGDCWVEKARSFLQDVFNLGKEAYPGAIQAAYRTAYKPLIALKHAFVEGSNTFEPLRQFHVQNMDAGTQAEFKKAMLFRSAAPIQQSSLFSDGTTVSPTADPVAFKTDVEPFLLAANTWTRTRVNIFQQLRQILMERFKLNGSRVITNISDWFLKKVDNFPKPLEKGEYGEVSQACVREWRGRDPVIPPTCVKINIPEIDKDMHAVYLAVKQFFAQTTDGDLDDLPVPYSAHNRQFTKWLATKNVTREIMIGRLLNLLVIAGTTPHLPLLYEPFLLTPDPSLPKERQKKGGVAMEFSNLKLGDLIELIVMSVNSKVSLSEAFKFLDVAILQIVHGLLCAQKHYDFGHNDLHSGNVMMTFITSTNFNYKVNNNYYKIPTKGMCWKIIDFGTSASTVFDSKDVAHAFLHAPILAHTLAYKKTLHDYTEERDVNHFALEFMDLLHLIDATRFHVEKACADQIRKGGVVKDVELRRDRVHEKLDRYKVMIQDISKASEKKNSLANAYSIWLHLTQGRQNAVLPQANPSLVKLVKSSGLMEIFFDRLCEEAGFKVGKRPAGAVFDADTSPFRKGSIELEGIHRTKITVHRPS